MDFITSVNWLFLDDDIKGLFLFTFLCIFKLFSKGHVLLFSSSYSFFWCYHFHYCSVLNVFIVYCYFLLTQTLFRHLVFVSKISDLSGGKTGLLLTYNFLRVDQRIIYMPIIMGTHWDIISSLACRWFEVFSLLRNDGIGNLPMSMGPAC